VKATDRIRVRLGSFAAILLVVVSACGGGTMSPTEYVEGLNDFVANAAPLIDGSTAEYERIANPTVEDWATFVERHIAILRDVDKRFGELDPPESIVEIHQLLRDALDRGLEATEALESVAARAATPAEAEQTPEYAEYLAANSEGSSRVCLDVQTKLDALAADSETFEGEPWLSDLQLTATAVLGCLPVEDD